MKFAEPVMLWTLLVVAPALALFFWWSWRQRQSLIRQFVQSRLLAALTVGVSVRRQQIKSTLLVVGVAALLIALARPHYEFDWEEAKQEGLDILIAVDTSRSMLAEDLQPDRMTRAKLAIRDLLARSTGDRKGLIAFAGSAFLQCPLTVDEGAFIESLDIIDVDLIPQGGTDLAGAIEVAIESFDSGEGAHRVLIVFSDGEDHGEEALEAAKRAEEEGIRIFTVGVGTRDGAALFVRDARGNRTPIRDENGTAVISRLDETLLQRVAGAGGGFHVRLADARTIDTLYERGLEPLPKLAQEVRQVKRLKDRFQWPLALAILLMAVEVFVSDRKPPKKTNEEVMTSIPRQWKNPGATALLLVLGLLAATASPKDAKQAYEAGDYRTAQEEYNRLLEKKRDDPRFSFNAGTAALAAGNYDRAANLMLDAQQSTDLALQQRGHYNRGNALFRQGETEMRMSPKVTMDRWEEAVGEYKSALSLDPLDEDARFNKELVERKLEILKRKMQQQGQSGDNSGQQNQQDQGPQGQNPGQPPGNQSGQQGQPRQPGEGQDGEQGDQEGDRPGGEQGPPQDQGDGGREQTDPADGGMEGGNPIEMTAEQARQMLEGMRGEEQAMRFLPQNRPNQQRDSRKNW